MKREMLKSYESPLTVRTQVALESGICAGSATIEAPEGEKIGVINAHEVEEDFGTSFGTGWDE